MSTNSKKHWYDKPLKFLYFLVVLFPFALLLGNYISCQLSYDKNKQITLIGSNNNITQETGRYEGADINNPYDYNFEQGYTTPMQNAIAYTILQLTEYPYFPESDNESLEIFFDNRLNMGPIKHALYELLLYSSNHAPETNFLFVPTIEHLMFFILIYELEFTIYFILLKVILFLPNVIIYIMDWTERKLKV